MEHNHFAPAEERRPELYRRLRSTTKKIEKCEININFPTYNLYAWVHGLVKNYKRKAGKKIKCRCVYFKINNNKV